MCKSGANYMVNEGEEIEAERKEEHLFVILREELESKAGV